MVLSVHVSRTERHHRGTLPVCSLLHSKRTSLRLAKACRLVLCAHVKYSNFLLTIIISIATGPTTTHDGKLQSRYRQHALANSQSYSGQGCRNARPNYHRAAPRDYLLKSLRNERVARITTLPEDVITMILIQAVALDPSLDSAPTSWKELTQISAVCQSWRVTALNCPALWALLLHYAQLGRCSNDQNRILSPYAYT